MRKNRRNLFILLILIPASLLFGGTGRPEDGFLFFVVILAFLGLVLGVLYLVDYIRELIRWLKDDYPIFL